MAVSGAKKTVLQTVGLVVFMGGLAWASVPFYDWFCRVTGFGGTTGVSEVASGEILDQTIKVRFDASLERNMPWQFTPMAREMELRIGETGWHSTKRTTLQTSPLQGPRATMSLPIPRAAFSPRLTASASKSRFWPPVSGCKCQ